MTELALNQRAQLVLKKLIQYHIEDGHPVGSQRLAQSQALSLSSASIRSVMADLTRQGYLQSPHTSAGRVPTEQAYRFFVDTLLTTTLSPEPTWVADCEQTIKAGSSGADVSKSVSQLLSQITNLAAMVVIPTPKKNVLRHLEFLPLSDQRLLVILVLNEKEVHNRIIQVDREYDASELNLLSQFVVHHFVGQTLDHIRSTIVADLKQHHQHMDQMMRDWLSTAEQALTTPSNEDACVVAGEVNLFPMAAEQGVDRLQELFDAFSQRQEVLKIMDRCLAAPGVQIFIGSESSSPAFVDCSVVAASYGATSCDVLGVLGVIGPQRMNYQKVISIVDVTAKLLTSIHQQDGHDSPPVTGETT